MDQTPDRTPEEQTHTINPDNVFHSGSEKVGRLETPQREFDAPLESVVADEENPDRPVKPSLPEGPVTVQDFTTTGVEGVAPVPPVAEKERKPWYRTMAAKIGIPAVAVAAATSIIVGSQLPKGGDATNTKPGESPVPGGDKTTSQTTPNQETTQNTELNTTYKSVSEFDIPATTPPQEVAEKSVTLDTAMVSGNFTKNTVSESRTKPKYSSLAPQQQGALFATENVEPLWAAGVIQGWEGVPGLVSLHTNRLQQNAIGVENFIDDGGDLKWYVTTETSDIKIVSADSSRIVADVTETEHYESTNPREQGIAAQHDGVKSTVRKTWEAVNGKWLLADYVPLNNQ